MTSDPTLTTVSSFLKSLPEFRTDKLTKAEEDAILARTKQWSPYVIACTEKHWGTRPWAGWRVE